MTTPRAPESLSAVLAWLESAPDGAMLPASALRAWLTPLLAVETPTVPVGAVTATWRERLWTAPPDTRMGVVEVAEALGRPSSWVYRRTGEAAAKSRLPHRKLDGELVFTAGEVREWLKQHEVTVARPVRWSGSPLTVHRGAA